MRKQAGFTLVELVVVIIILGILAATALPRFMNVQTQAHQAAVDGVAGALGSAVVLVHAQWVANGNTGAVANLTGFGEGNVDTNATGWPVGTGGNTTLTTAAHCKEVWDSIMLNPPVVDTVAADIAGADYQVVYATNVCTYTYQGDAATTRSIAMTATSGSIAKVNP